MKKIYLSCCGHLALFLCIRIYRYQITGLENCRHVRYKI